MKNVYLIGIGGIGMSALARYFLNTLIFTAATTATIVPIVMMRGPWLLKTPLLT